MESIFSIWTIGLHIHKRNFKPESHKCIIVSGNQSLLCHPILPKGFVKCKMIINMFTYLIRKSTTRNFLIITLLYNILTNSIKKPFFLLLYAINGSLLQKQSPIFPLEFRDTFSCKDKRC